MSSRDWILSELRRAGVPPRPAPGPFTLASGYDDPHAKFLDVLRAVGGSGARVEGHEALRAEVARVAAERGATRIASRAPGIDAATVTVDPTADPHTLADVQLAVLPGELAVAENGAVWVTPDRDAVKALYYLAEHVVLVVPGERVVCTLHEAYAWIDAHADAAAPRFGAFVSGPSKTADIEQALVIGAHGPRSLHVVLFD